MKLILEEIIPCSAPSCDRFGHHGDWKKIMANKIIKKEEELISRGAYKWYNKKI